MPWGRGDPALAQFVEQISTLLTNQIKPTVRDQQKTLQEQVKKLQQAVLDCDTGQGPQWRLQLGGPDGLYWAVLAGVLVPWLTSEQPAFLH